MTAAGPNGAQHVRTSRSRGARSSPDGSSGGSSSAGTARNGDGRGNAIVKFDMVATLVFGLTALYSAIVFDTTAQWVGAITAMALFAIGVVAFLWSFGIALQRSRFEELSVAEVYLLMGQAVPTDISRKMNGLIAVQFAIGLVTSFMRLDGPNGSPGSSLMVGLLVPMLGFGLNGLWASRHGTYRPRSTNRPASTTSTEEIRQNAKHG